MVTDSQACVVRVHKFEWEREKRSSKIWLSAIFANWASSWCLFSYFFLRLLRMGCLSDTKPGCAQQNSMQKVEERVHLIWKPR